MLPLVASASINSMAGEDGKAVLKLSLSSSAPATKDEKQKQWLQIQYLAWIDRKNRAACTGAKAEGISSCALS